MRLASTSAPACLCAPWVLHIGTQRARRSSKEGSWQPATCVKATAGEAGGTNPLVDGFTPHTSIFCRSASAEAELRAKSSRPLTGLSRRCTCHSSRREGGAAASRCGGHLLGMATPAFCCSRTPSVPCRPQLHAPSAAPPHAQGHLQEQLSATKPWAASRNKACSQPAAGHPDRPLHMDRILATSLTRSTRWQRSPCRKRSPSAPTTNPPAAGPPGRAALRSAPPAPYSFGTAPPRAQACRAAC